MAAANPRLAAKWHIMKAQQQQALGNWEASAEETVRATQLCPELPEVRCFFPPKFQLRVSVLFSA